MSYSRSICKLSSDSRKAILIARYQTEAGDLNAIIEATAQTVAHEIGHILWLKHDDDEDCYDQPYQLMWQQIPRASTWSTCSRERLAKAYARKNLSCLHPPAAYDTHCGGDIHCKSSYICDTNTNKCRVDIGGDCSSQTCSSAYTCDATNRCIESDDQRNQI